MLNRFDDRYEGGRALAQKLSEYKNRSDVVVLALPRGGVPVGYEIAQFLNTPLDVFIVRKLGVPGHEELAFGAISSGGFTVLNKALINTIGLSSAAIEKIVEKEQKVLEKQENLYRLNRPLIDLEGRTAIVVDDGIATGATINAAIAGIRSKDPREILIAAPVAFRGVCDDISEKSDAFCVCVIAPEPFFSVGTWYRNFNQVSDSEVCRLLEKAETNQKFLSAV